MIVRFKKYNDNIRQNYIIIAIYVYKINVLQYKSTYIKI